MRDKVRTLTHLSALIALSLILGKFLTISTGLLRINLGNIPIFIAGIFYGSWAGFAVAASVDILGCVLKGYTLNPLIALGVGMFGICAGLHYRLECKVFLAHLIGSVVINSLALRLMYGYSWALLAARIPNSCIVGLVEIVILKLLLGNREFTRLMEERPAF